MESENDEEDENQYVDEAEDEEVSEGVNEDVEEDENENEPDDDIDPDARSNVSHVDFCTVTADEVKGMEFADVESAYAFYNEYAKVKGFSVRKSRRGKNKNDQITWQQFVCSRDGFQDSKYMNLPNRQKEHRVLTRFGCEAEMWISFVTSSGRWFVSRFGDYHNHQLLGDKFFGFFKVTSQDV